MRGGGASFFSQLHEAVGGGYPGETLDALWSLVWRGLVTNDTFHALRAYVAKPPTRASKRQHNLPAFRSRRTTPPSAQGRWTLLAPQRLAASAPASAQEQTNWSHAIALQLLNRYGVLTRETVAQENLPGGFSAVYDVLKALEESGRIRRGYFVAGLGAAQFALPAAVDLLRSLRNGPHAGAGRDGGACGNRSRRTLMVRCLRWPAAEEATDEGESGHTVIDAQRGR